MSQGHERLPRQKRFKKAASQQPGAAKSGNLSRVPSQLETYLASLQRFGIRPGLERIRALLHAAGDPQNSYPTVLVGGTNGKGSTCEFLARRLSAHGRIGLYTSPHLYRWNERIRVIDAAEEGAAGDGLFQGAISDNELAVLLREAMPLIESVAEIHQQPTEFEIITFLGLWHFARAGVAAAVIEVGLGGTWDATNVTEPLVSVVTHVALDHRDRLGETREEIARDKVGIVRPGRAFVTAETRPELLEIFREKCASIDARLVQVASDAETGPDAAPEPAAGNADAVPAWQRLNARTAATAARELENALGWPHAEREFRLRVPGRAEIVHHNPMIILDGANNPDGAARLAEHLRETFPGRTFTFIAGFSADKEWPAMLDNWRPLAGRWILTQAAHQRAAAAAKLAEALQDAAVPVETVPEVGRAIERALESSGPDDIIVIAGSFFVLAEVDRALLL